MKPQVDLHRRTFLRHGAGLLASAAVLPTLIPITALGGKNRMAPSERVNMGFIGLGGQGTGHLLGGAWTYVPGGYIARNDVQVVAVCDVRRECLEMVQRDIRSAVRPTQLRRCESI